MNKNFFNSKMLAKLGIFVALSSVLYILEFSIIFLFPDFLKMNFSDIPVLMSGFMLGPVAGVLTVLVKVLFKLLISPSPTGGIGEIGDFFISGAFVFVASVIYKKHRTIKGAAFGIIFGSIASVIIALLCNAFILLPTYGRLVGGYAVIVSWCSPFVPQITEQNFIPCYLAFIALPFNLLRCAVMGLLTFLLYKRISRLFARF